MEGYFNKMCKSRFSSIVSVILVSFCLLLSNINAEILFEEDFEGGKLDEKKWHPKAEWKIIKPEEKLAALGKGVMDTAGGEANTTKEKNFKDFIFEADFNAKKDGSLTGFVFGAQDLANNFYMHQISATGSNHTPNHLRSHIRLKGAWQVFPIAFLKGEKVDPEVWYRSRWIVKNFNFKDFVLESEDFWKNPRGAKMRKIADWTDKSRQFRSGAVGFRASGGEHMRYDNVLVYDIGDDPFSVDPSTKLSTVWGELKMEQ